MQWKVPGTEIMADPGEAGRMKEMLDGLFLTGGISLGQVCAITGLEGYRIQNWVRRRFLSSPVEKKYSMNQLCRILTIQALKDTLSMERITCLLSYVNGELDREQDDLIEDSTLYLLFVRLAAQVYTQNAPVTQAIEEAVKSLPEKEAGANEKIETVLKIMLFAWCAHLCRETAEEMLEKL